MRAALAGLLGSALATWGHFASSSPAFYLGVLVLIIAAGPLAFADGRGRWPAGLLRTGTVVAVALVGLLAIEAVLAAAAAVRRAQPATVPQPVFRYADARADPDAFRRWWQHSSEAFRSRPFIQEDPTGKNPFVLKPSSHARVHESEIRINALGFRGQEIARDKGDAYRIVALGESTTFGRTLFASDRPWPEVLEQEIRETLGCAARVQVVNGGVPGWTLSNQLKRLDQEILPLDPDLVISYHGYNGFSFLFRDLPSMLVQTPPRAAERPSRLIAAIENRIALRRFLARYAGARELARSVGTIDLGSSGYAVRYRKLARRLAARGIPLALATFNMAVNDESPEDVIRFYEETFPDIRARMLANRMHTKLVLEVPLGGNVIPVDTREGVDGAYDQLYVDAAHLTQEGRRRLAANLLAGIREPLLASPRMRCDEGS